MELYRPLENRGHYVTNPNPEKSLESGTQVNKHWMQNGFLRNFCLKLVFLSISMFYAILSIRVLVMTSMMMNVKMMTTRPCCDGSYPSRLGQCRRWTSSRPMGRWAQRNGQLGFCRRCLFGSDSASLVGWTSIQFWEKVQNSWWSWMSLKR